MKAQVFSVDGVKVSDIELPSQFGASVDVNLIKRAVQAIQSAGVQVKYPYIYAGRYNTAAYVGFRGKPAQYRSINIERARKPKLKNRRGLASGQVASIPAVVKGPKAHPPKREKIWAEKINKKEKRKATISAIAATANVEFVKKRGHVLPKNLQLPIVVEQKFEDIAKTKNVVKSLEAIGVFADVERAKAKRKIRAGKGKKRGRRYKVRKSLLIVAKSSEKIAKACRNIPGVDIVRVKDLNADVLAPGGVPGRLTVWTEGAIRELSGQA
jgi:large subunit ribosomal protein L4e